MSTTPERQRLQEEFRVACEGDDRRLYALFDAARIRGLPVFLREISAEFAPLYRGKPATELAHVAPYIARLPLTSLIIPWLLVDPAPAQVGMFLVAGTDADALRHHLRRYLIILDAKGGENFFRFYDPRVIAPFLEASTPEETACFFGPIRRLMVCASVPPVKAPLFRSWTAPAAPRALAPPTASNKFRLRPEHEERFAKDTWAFYELRCVAYLKAHYSIQLRDKASEDVRQIVTSAKEIAAGLGITAGRDVTTLAEVLVLDPDFAARERIKAKALRERPLALMKLRDYLRQKQSASAGLIAHI
jgi:hypothetical protein